MISNKQIFDGLHAAENQNKRKIQTENKTRQDKNLKINSIQVMQNLFSFQTPFKFLKNIHWIYQLVQETFSHFALKEKHKKTGKGLPCND